MFRYTLVLLAGLASVGSAPAASWADALFDELSKDFGSVPRGPALTHPFRLKNNTSAPVRIAGIQVSCNQCLSATAAKQELQPGEETQVVVRLDTQRFAGAKNLTIYVRFDRPQNEEVRLWVQANSRDDVSVNPDTLAFGHVKRASKPSASTTITFLGNVQTQIVEVNTESNYVQTVVKEKSRQGTEVSYELTATLRADAPVGKWYTDIWLKTNNATMPRVRVPLTVEIESALSVSPALVTLGPVKIGEAAERKVIVRGIKPFKITGITGTDGQVSVKDSTVDSKTLHVLTVTLKAEKPGELSRTFKVVTDLKEEGEIEFQARAQVVP